MSIFEKQPGETNLPKSVLSPDPAQLRFENLAGRGAEIFETLEKPAWAPWLAFAAETFEQHAKLFPQGQILLCNQDSHPLAMLSTNRISWDGQLDNLTTWDDVAGHDRSFSQAYDPYGNTLVLMSFTISSEAQGQNLTEVLVNRAREIAIAEGIDHIISDFRPSGYGKYKAENADPGFRAYVDTRRDDGQHVDPWLRSLERKGMHHLQPDLKANIVHTSVNTLDYLREGYKPDGWRLVTDPGLIRLKLEEHAPQEFIGDIEEVWECQETGTWYVNRTDGQTVYVESNLWGELALV